MVYAGPAIQRISRGKILRAQYNRQTKRYTVDLRVDSVRRVRPISSLVLEAFVGLRPPGLQTCHNDGDSTNDHLSNLRWDTPSENMWDKTRHGTHHNIRKTHCPQGHEYAGDNLIYADRRRICRECRRVRGRLTARRRRAELRSLNTTAT